MYLLEIQNKENLQSELNFIQKQSLEKELECEEKIKYLEQKHKQELLDRDTQINEFQSTLDLVKVQRQNDALDFPLMDWTLNILTLNTMFLLILISF